MVRFEGFERAQPRTTSQIPRFLKRYQSWKIHEGYEGYGGYEGYEGLNFKVLK
jgi:hypothetical protein